MYKSIHRWIPSWYYWWKQQWLVISHVIQFFRQATPWQDECYLCNWLLFIFPVLPSGDSEKKKKKKKKIKEEPDSDWWCHNDIMWSTILSCVHLVEFYRLVRMLKEEREREVENVLVVFRVIYVNFVKDNLLYFTSSK